MKKKLDFLKSEFPLDPGKRVAGPMAEKAKVKTSLPNKRFIVIGIALLAIAVICITAFNIFSSKGSSFAVSSPNSSEAELASEDASSSCIYVHVGGAVVNPGMYALSNGARVDDAIKAAGGFAEGAAVDSLNLARQLSDGEQIIVSTVVPNASGAQGADAGSASASANSGLVNINTASVKDLTALPGIGEATAKKIVADREANGAFKTKEDLKRVSGIGDKKYESLADLICV